MSSKKPADNLIAESESLSSNARKIWKALAGGSVRFKQDMEFNAFAAANGMSDVELGPATEELFALKMAEIVSEGDELVFRAMEPKNASVAETASVRPAEPDEYTEQLTARLQLALVQSKLGEADNAQAPAQVIQRLAQSQMPFWSDEVRAEANTLIRSALFSATPLKAPRETVRNERVASLDGVEITFSGERLNQFDAQVFEAIMHLAREQSLGTECKFSLSGYSILKALGVENTVSSSRAVEDSLYRLREATLVIKWVGSRAKRVGGLVSFYEKTEAGHFRVGLVPEMTEMFERDATFMPRKLLASVRRSPLASWLVRFLLSHKDPFPISYEKLLSLSGSEETNPRKFKLNVKKQIDRLAGAHKKLAEDDPDYAGETGREEWLVADAGKTVAVAHHRSSRTHRAAVAAEKKRQKKEVGEQGNAVFTPPT